MKLFIFLAIVLLVIYIVKKQKNFSVAEHHTPVINQKIVGYKKRYRIMNETEASLFFELKKQLPNYYIFPNMRIADVIDAINGEGFYNRRNKILPKHLDFVICNTSFKPVAAVELNGSSHDRADRMEKDEEKRQILEEAQLPLVIIKTGDNYEESIKKSVISLVS